MNITPQIGTHALIVGQTGSGKTTTARTLLQSIAGRYPVLVIDSKGDGSLEQMAGASVATLPSQLRFPRGKKPLWVYKPEGVLNEPEYLDLVLQQAYESGRSLYVYIDETYQVCSTGKPGRGLSNLLMRGRHRRIGNRDVRCSVLMSAQRPAWIPRHCGTEATSYYIHRLMEEDRKRMIEYTGSRNILTDPPDRHQFYFYRHGMPEAIKMQIQLKGGS